MYKVSRPCVLQLIGCYVENGAYCHGDGAHVCTQLANICLRLFVLPWQHVTWLVNEYVILHFHSLRWQASHKGKSQSLRQLTCRAVRNRYLTVRRSWCAL